MAQPFSGIASAAASAIGCSIALSTQTSKQHPSLQDGVLKTLIPSKRLAVGPCKPREGYGNQSLTCLKASITKWGIRDAGALCEVVYHCKEAERRLSLSEESVIAVRSRAASLAITDSLRRADDSLLQLNQLEKGHSFSWDPELGNYCMDSPSGGRFKELERKQSSSSKVSPRAGQRPDASKAAASLQQHLSRGGKDLQACLSEPGGGAPISELRVGVPERRRSSSTAVLRVLQQCQQLEEDIAARNWDQGAGGMETGGSEVEKEITRGARMSGKGGGHRGEPTAHGGTADEPASSRPHSERSFHMRERHPERTESPLGQRNLQGTRPIESELERRQNEVGSSHERQTGATGLIVQERVRNSDSDRGGPRAEASDRRRSRASSGEGPVEKDSHRQPSWLEEEEMAFNGPEGAPERSSDGPERASKRGFVRESGTEREHREQSWLEGEEGPSERRRGPSEQASRKTSARPSEEEMEHRKQSWLADEEWAPEAPGRTSERASIKTSGRASERTTQEGEKEHPKQSWLRVSQDEGSDPRDGPQDVGVLEERPEVSRRESGRLSGGQAMEDAGSNQRKTSKGGVRQSTGFSSEAQRRNAEGAAPDYGVEFSDQGVSASGKLGGVHQTSSEVRTGFSEDGMSAPVWKKRYKTAFQRMEETERNNSRQRNSTTGVVGQISRSFEGRLGRANANGNRVKSWSEIPRRPERTSETGMKLLGREFAPVEVRQKERVTGNAPQTNGETQQKRQSNPSAAFNTLEAVHTGAERPERLSVDGHLREGAPWGEESDGSVKNAEGGARAFEMGVEVLPLAEGVPCWTSVEPSGFVGQGKVGRSCGSSRGASGSGTPLIRSSSGGIAAEMQNGREELERRRSQTVSVARETEERKTGPTSDSRSTIRAFFEENTWHERIGFISAGAFRRESSDGSRPESRLSDDKPAVLNRPFEERVSAQRTSENNAASLARGSLTERKEGKVSGSRSASEGRGAGESSDAETPDGFRTGASRRNDADTRNSTRLRNSVDEGNSTGGRNDLSGGNGSDGSQMGDGREDIRGRNKLKGRQLSENEKSVSRRNGLDGGYAWVSVAKPEIEKRLSNSGEDPMESFRPNAVATTRQGYVASREPIQNARAGSTRSSSRESNSVNPNRPGSKASDGSTPVIAREQVNPKRGKRKSVQRGVGDGKEWAEKRVTSEREKNAIRVERVSPQPRVAVRAGKNDPNARDEEGKRLDEGPIGTRSQNDARGSRYPAEYKGFEERDFDKELLGDDCSGDESDSCRVSIDGNGTLGMLPRWGSTVRNVLGSSRGLAPGDEMTERERYEKEMQALTQLVREYEAGAMQNHSRELEMGASRGQFLLEPGTGSTLLGTPVSELSLELPTPPEPHQKRAALGGLAEKQTEREPAKGAGKLKRSLAETRQAAREAIKSVRAVYCASGCATQQLREGERVWKQQLALSRTAEREHKARAQRAEVQATRLGSLLDWRVREVAHLKAALAERTARLDQAELRLDELERGNAAAGEGMREALKVAKKERNHILYLLRKALKQLKSADQQLNPVSKPPRNLPERFRTEPADAGASDGDSDAAAMTTPGSDATSAHADVMLTPLAGLGSNETRNPVFPDDWAAKMAELQRSLDKQRAILTDHRRWS